LTKQLIKSDSFGNKSATTRATKVGDLVFLMGHISTDNCEEEVVGKGDITTQTRRVFDLMRLTMEDAGGTLDDLVHLVIYTTSRDQIPQVGEIRKEFFKGDWPTSSTIIAKSLSDPDFLIEIEGIAALTHNEIIRSSRLGDTPPRSRAIKAGNLVFSWAAFQ
jgi:enamine deaminase RidA (YjgF/YER057c/UK114 family)